MTAGVSAGTSLSPLLLRIHGFGPSASAPIGWVTDLPAWAGHEASVLPSDSEIPGCQK